MINNKRKRNRNSRAARKERLLKAASESPRVKCKILSVGKQHTTPCGVKEQDRKVIGQLDGKVIYRSKVYRTFEASVKARNRWLRKVARLHLNVS